MEKPVIEWNEEDYLKAHIKLWTEIREKVKNGYNISKYWVARIKREIVSTITPDVKICADCYLCECYETCHKCPLHSYSMDKCKFYGELCDSSDYTLSLILIDYIITSGQDRLYEIMRDRDVKQ